MESKTNCKIAIRGKGSVKEGARGRRDGKMMEGDDEPLHVVITGDNQANVDAAADMINQMLVVIDDDKNVHKQQQLRELALLNGTLKDDEYCPICAEKGHRAFECPKRFSINKGVGVAVKCAICGDTSHPTRDCRMNKAGIGGNPDICSVATTGGEDKAEKELDSDYMAFMNELDGKAPGDTEEAKASAAAAAAAAADRKQQLESLITTIEKTAGGVTTKFAPVAPTKKPTSDIPPPPVPPAGGSLITTISSRIVKSTPGEEEQTPELPPPPAELPPPPQPQPSYYGQQQQQPQQNQTPQGSYYPQQQQYGYQQQQYGVNSYGGYQGNTANQSYYGQQGYQQQQQNQQPQQQQNGGVAGWDYQNYYGSGNTGGDAGGAGGFNWWESS